MHGPIQTRDSGLCAAAYMGILDWPLAIGHRFRPRGGCTCRTPESCPAPGAHPLSGSATARSPEQFLKDLAEAPGASLIAPTQLFDAIVLPRLCGMAAMVSLDRLAPVPCLTTADQAALFVQPSTARYAVDGGIPAGVELRSGPGAWVALPPSHGTRWDTPPWHEQTHEPLPLLHGKDLRPHITDVLVVASQAADATAAQPR